MGNLRVQRSGGLSGVVENLTAKFGIAMGKPVVWAIFVEKTVENVDYLGYRVIFPQK